MSRTSDRTAPLIRPAEPDDVAAITEIYRHEVLHGTGTFEIDPPDRDAMAARRAKLIAAGYPYLVATSTDGVLGYAYGGPFRERAAFRYTVEDSIYVRPDVHGRGVGRSLLAALMEDATGRGFRQMVAFIGDSTNAGSVALHRKLGFTHSGLLKAFGWKFGRWLDCVLMQCALGDGDGTPGEPS